MKRTRKILKPAAPQGIGGIPIGCASLGGIYTDYQLANGEDFDGPLDVVHVANPLAPYFSTHNYGSGARSVQGRLRNSYDSDPYHQGAQDCNRGVPCGISDTLYQSGSVLNIKVRTARYEELRFINGRSLVAAMFHTAGHMVFTPPFIFEARIAFTAGNASGWHPTGWLISTSPALPTAPLLEFDFPEGSSKYPESNTNILPISGGPPLGGGWSGQSTSLQSKNLYGTGFHTYTTKVTASSVQRLLDGALIHEEPHDGTITGKPYQYILSGHTFDDFYGGDSGVNLAAWQALGDRGAVMSCDWIRCFVPTSSPAPTVKPLVTIPPTQISYGAAFNITLPSLAELWGPGFAGTDYFQCLKHEDFEPGINQESVQAYAQVPAGTAYNEGTRVFSGTPSNLKPGRMHFGLVANLPGTVSIVARSYCDVGPTIVPTQINILNGATVNRDMFFDCDCGTLSRGAVITMTGLPPGLSFDPTTMFLTGTCTTNGTYSATLGVTNAVGQTASAAVSIAVSSPATPMLDTAVTSPTSGFLPIVYQRLNTSQAGVIYVMVYSQSSRVTAVSDTNGLTWTRRSTTVTSGSLNLDTFYAVSPTAYAGLIAIATNASTGPNGRLVIAGIANVNATPFDPNVSVPAPAMGTTAQALSTTVSSTGATGMIVSFLRSTQSLGTITRPAGFAVLTPTVTSQDIAFKTFASARAGEVEAFSWTGSTANSGVITDIIQGL